MVLWEIVAREVPYKDVVNEGIIERAVCNGGREDVPADCAPHFAQVIPLTWAADPTARPSAAAVVAVLAAALPALEQDEAAAKTAPWHFDATLKMALAPDEVFRLIPAGASDRAKVEQFYAHHPVPGQEIDTVQIIYNPTLNRAFALNMQLLQQRVGRQVCYASIP
jgi:hypothetical protein